MENEVNGAEREANHDNSATSSSSDHIPGSILGGPLGEAYSMKDSLAQWATDTMHLYRLANENPGLPDPPPEAQVLIQAMKDRFARYSDEEMLHMFLDLLGVVEDRSGADKASEFVQIAHGVMNEQYTRLEAELIERIQNHLGVENIRIIRL